MVAEYLNLGDKFHKDLSFDTITCSSERVYGRRRALSIDFLFFAIQQPSSLNYSTPNLCLLLHIYNHLRCLKSMVGSMTPSHKIL